MAAGRRDVDDYSFSRPAMAALARGLMRYLFANGKGLTAAEVAVIARAGKMLGLNYEAGAGDFLGAAAGRRQAVAAAQLASRLPVRKAPTIFSADWPVPVTQFRGVGDALEAAAAVLGWGWVGCYGHAGLIDYLWSRFGDAAFYWQTYAWSGGRLSRHADLYQWLNGQNVTGGQVDFNQIVGRNFLTALGSAPAGGGVLIPSHPSEEDDLTPEQATQLAAVSAALPRLMRGLDQLDYVFKRESAITPDNLWYTVDAAGAAHLAAPGAPGARPVALLNTLDGNTIVLELQKLAAALGHPAG